MQDLLEKFNQLSDREKLLVSISAILAVIFVFYFALWAPINNALDKQRDLVTSKQADLLWVQKNANRAVQLRTGSDSSTSFSGSLPQVVNQTANRLNIAISRMQPQDEELKVWVDQAPFNDVVSWLQSLESKGIRIINVDLAEADQAGMVKIRSLQLGKS
jgi:general secretion pathway protein M